MSNFEEKQDPEYSWGSKDEATQSIKFLLKRFFMSAPWVIYPETANAVFGKDDDLEPRILTKEEIIMLEKKELIPPRIRIYDGEVSLPDYHLDEIELVRNPLIIPKEALEHITLQDIANMVIRLDNTIYGGKGDTYIAFTLTENSYTILRNDKFGYTDIVFNAKITTQR